MLRKRAVIWLLLGLVGLLVAGSSPAHDSVRPPWRPPIDRQGFSVSLEDGFGRTLPTFRLGATRFVLGEPGQRYVIRATNHTSRRVEAVISVDGRDAVSGRVASFATQRGYVLPPHGTLRLEGFRESLDDVRTFRFTDPHDSYSARMGTIQNVGIVGVAFFPERRARPEPPLAGAPEASKRREARAPRSSSAEDHDSNLGTEYGERRSSRVVEVPFVRENRSVPASVLTLRYDDARGLRARGIDVSSSDDHAFVPPPRQHPPEAFPGQGRFAPPPPR